MERFFAGWVPAGLDQSPLEDLRLWWAHGILWWAGLSLSLGADLDVDLTDVYAATWHSVQNGDPVSWRSRDAAAAGSLTGPRSSPRSIAVSGGIVFKQEAPLTGRITDSG